MALMNIVKLEGQFPGLGRSRTSYMEDYQPAMATVLAAAMATPEDPGAWEDVNAVEEVKEVQGKLVQLMTGNRAEPIRTVQRLHETSDILPLKLYVNSWNHVAPQKLLWTLLDSFNVMLACATENPTRLYLRLQRW